MYGQTYSMAHITMVEDFTEGGDISIPFRLPFEWVFGNLAALTMLFDRASELNNQGAWAADTGGSTPTSNTGPHERITPCPLSTLRPAAATGPITRITAC